MTIKVLHLINQLGYGGGAERQLLLNLKHFDNTKVKNIVCQVYPEGTEYSDQQAAEELRSIGIQVTSLDFVGKTGWLISLYRLMRLIRSEQIEVIHTSLLLADFLGLLAGALTRTPVVVTLVNATYGPEWVDDNPAVSQWKHRLFMRIYRFLIRRFCSHTTAISKAVKAHGVQHLGLQEDQTTVIYRSINPDWKRVNGSPNLAKISSLKTALNLENAYPVLLNVARVVPNKGQKYLLQALAKLKGEYPHIKLLIAGEITPQMNLLKTSNELGLEEQVTLLNYRSDVHDLHCISDIGIFSSLYEGFGNAFAEACASGLPCVVTDIGPFMEITDNGRTAVTVQTRSADALADGIYRLLQDPQYAADLGTQAQKRVFETFTVDQAVLALTEIYHKVAKHQTHSFCANETNVYVKI